MTDSNVPPRSAPTAAEAPSPTGLVKATTYPWSLIWSWARRDQHVCCRLASGTKCPRCGGTAVELAWLPGGAPAARGGRDLYQCVVASGRG